MVRVPRGVKVSLYMILVLSRFTCFSQVFFLFELLLVKSLSGAISSHRSLCLCHLVLTRAMLLILFTSGAVSPHPVVWACDCATSMGALLFGVSQKIGKRLKKEDVQVPMFSSTTLSFLSTILMPDRAPLKKCLRYCSALRRRHVRLIVKKYWL